MITEKDKKEYVKVFKKVINDSLFDSITKVMAWKTGKFLYDRPEDYDVLIDTKNKKGEVRFYKDGNKENIMGRYRFTYKIRFRIWVKLTYERREE